MLATSTESVVTLIVVLWVANALTAAAIGKYKGRSFIGFFLYGVMAPIVAIALALILRPVASTHPFSRRYQPPVAQAGYSQTPYSPNIVPAMVPPRGRQLPPPGTPLSAPPPPAPAPSSMAHLDQLERLAAAHQRGTLSDDEFAMLKRRLLDG